MGFDVYARIYVRMGEPSQPSQPAAKLRKPFQFLPREGSRYPSQTLATLAMIRSHLLLFTAFGFNFRILWRLK